MPTVSMEQLMAWQPDAILVSECAMSDTQQSDLYDEICGDSLWRDLRAVRGGQVFRIPQSPFGWIGRPPSAARLLGCLWLADALYPAQAHFDMKTEAREFYALFYRRTLSDAGCAPSCGTPARRGAPFAADGAAQCPPPDGAAGRAAIRPVRSRP